MTGDVKTRQWIYKDRFWIDLTIFTVCRRVDEYANDKKIH